MAYLALDKDTISNCWTFLAPNKLSVSMLIRGKFQVETNEWLFVHHLLKKAGNKRLALKLRSPHGFINSSEDHHIRLCTPNTADVMELKHAPLRPTRQPISDA